MEFISGGSAVMEGGILEAGKDVGKMQFQQELSRWFENRGVIADLRSHLRHLMITALQSNQVGVKPTDRSSPKAQALNLMIAEYLFRHKCHYTLSVFTSEVPTLANFNLDPGLQGGRKRPVKNYFQENEVEEIFNALGLSSRLEELAPLKRRYLEKDSQVSLLELFLQITVELATKLQVQQNLESHVVEGDRVLSKEWSSKVVDVLLGEKLPPSRVSTLEGTIFRITESEMRRSLEEQRKSQVEMLSKREKRIQEYLRKHEDEILIRLTEAEKELTTRKDAIEENLTEREKHLTKMALEWNNKHAEILRLSKKFHNIEEENRNFRKKLKDLEEEKKHLRTQEERQSRTIQDLREELNSLLEKLKEVTESNAILSERLQVLISRDGKEVLLRQDGANQGSGRGSVEIPLLWSKSRSLDAESSHLMKEESAGKCELEELSAKKELQPSPEQWNANEPKRTISCDADVKKTTRGCDSSDEGDDVSLSSSLADVIHGVQEKLQVLEEESNRLNQSYLEYKLKCISVDSDSESLNNASVKSPSPARSEVCITEAKFCQTNIDETYVKIQKLKETRVAKFEFDGITGTKSELPSKKPDLRTPTKRQLQNREFYLKSRHLVRQLEKQHAEELQTSSSDSSASTCDEELTPSSNRKSPAEGFSLTLLRTASVRSDGRSRLGPSEESVRKPLAESSNQIPKSDADCLALLEEARIKTPQASARRPLRQQMLLSESEKETEDENKEPEGHRPPKSSSPRSGSSGRMSVGKKNGNDGFW